MNVNINYLLININYNNIIYNIINIIKYILIKLSIEVKFNLKNFIKNQIFKKMIIFHI